MRRTVENFPINPVHGTRQNHCGERRITMHKKGISRRDFIKYTALGSGVMLAGGIPLGQALAGTKFTLAMSGGSWGDGNKKVFVEYSGFAKKYDVDMDYSIQIESVAVAKGIANKDNPIYDVDSCFSANGAKLLVAGAAFPELDFNIVTNWPDVYQQAKMGKYFAGYCFLNLVLAYNTKYVKRPDSYKDMWNPEYKGHVGIPAYGWVGNYYLHAINKFFGGTEDNTMPGIEALAELVKKQKALVPDTVDLVKKLFHSGELWIMPFWDGRTRQLQEEGAPVDYVWEKDFLSMTMGMSPQKNTKVPKLTMEFVNTTLRPDVEVEFMKIFKYAPTNRKAIIPSEYESVKIPEKELQKAADLDWIKVVTNLEKNLELWNKHVLGA
jgi:putative spermidine/putrescine transport system substrate-binding protein